jgi:hypothetical protein
MLASITLTSDLQRHAIKPSEAYRNFPFVVYEIGGRTPYICVLLQAEIFTLALIVGDRISLSYSLLQLDAEFEFVRYCRSDESFTICGKA